MVKGYKLRVKRLPKTVCISIRAGRGKTLAKKKYVKRGRKYRKRSKKTSRLKVGKTKLCSKKSNRSPLVCQRLARASCLTNKGTLKKKKICRTMARNRGLKSKTAKRRSSGLSSAGTLPVAMFKSWADLISL